MTSKPKSKQVATDSEPLRTPDGRYLIIVGKAGPRLWRASDPALPSDQRQALVDALMAARRLVKAAKNDPEALAGARADVDAAKRSLGERGPVWWSDGAADINRTLVKNSPYQEWWRHALKPDRLANRAQFDARRVMDLDDLLKRYFGTSNLSEASPAMQESGIDRLRVDFGLETDRPKRFALWSLLYMLGQAPDLDVAFKEEADKDAARNLMDLMAASSD